MTNYEAMVVIDSALQDDQKSLTVDFVKDIIKAEGGEVGETNIMGLRKLAYPIEKKNEGYYAVIEFTGPSELPAELDRRLKISDDVMRHIIINKDLA